MIGPVQDQAELEGRYREAVTRPGALEESLRKAGFSDPLIQRMGKLVLVRPHTRDSLTKVAEKNLKALAERAAHREIDLVFTDPLKEYLGTRNYNFETGAGQVAGTVKDLVESNLSRVDLELGLQKGQKVIVDVRPAQDRKQSDKIAFREEKTGREILFEVPQTKAQQSQVLAEKQREKLFHFEEEMSKVVIGQPEAIRAIRKAVGSKHSQLAANKDAPAVVVLLGPTSTGKTHTGQALGKYWHGDGKAVFDFNMAQISDLAHFNVLIGAPPGYLGFKEGASLADFVDRYPDGGVIILNEFEKAGTRADRDGIYGKLFDILADGKFTAGDTRERSLKNHTLVITMNAGDRKLFKLGEVPADLITHEYLQRQFENIRPSDVDNVLREYFSDPLIRRLKSTGDPVVMRPHTPETLEQIAKGRLEEIAKRAREAGGVEMAFDNRLVRAIVDHANPWEGAGSILKGVESLVRGNLTDAELRLGLSEGDKLRIDYEPKTQEVVFQRESGGKPQGSPLRYPGKLGNTVSPEAEARVQEALAKIPAEYRPPRDAIAISSAEGLKSMGGIWVGGAFLPEIDRIVLSESDLLRSPAEKTAVVLVHERFHQKDFQKMVKVVTPEQAHSLYGMNPGLFEWGAHRQGARFAMEQGWELAGVTDRESLELTRDEFVRRTNESRSRQLTREDGRPVSRAEREEWLARRSPAEDIKQLSGGLELLDEFRHEADRARAKSRMEKVVETARNQKAIAASSDQPRAPTASPPSTDTSGRYYDQPEYRQGIESIANELRKNNSFLIVTDVARPDADTVGSALALAEELRRSGKQVDVFNARKLHNSPLKTLPGFDQIINKVPDISRYDLVITTDLPDAKGTGLASELANARKIVRIDHHRSDKPFAHINFEVPEAPATAEMVYDILKNFKPDFSPETARNLFAGLVFDTQFRYEGTTDRTLSIAGELAKTGHIKPVEYFRQYASPTFSASDMKLVQDGLNTFKVSPDGQSVSMELTQDVLQGRKVNPAVRYALLDLARNIQEAKTAVLYYEPEPGNFRVNFRSERGVDVSKIARELGGGGHPGAAGTELRGTLSEVKRTVEETVARAVSETPQAQRLWDSIFRRDKTGGDSSAAQQELLSMVQAEVDARKIARELGVELDGKPTHYRAFEGADNQLGGYRDPLTGEMHINTRAFSPNNITVLHEIDHERQAQLLGNRQFDRRYQELQERQEAILEPAREAERRELGKLPDREIDRLLEPYRATLGEGFVRETDRPGKIEMMASIGAIQKHPEAINPFELSAEAFRRGMQEYLGQAGRETDGSVRVDRDLLTSQVRTIADEQAKGWTRYLEANASDPKAAMDALGGLKSAFGLVASAKTDAELRQLAEAFVVTGAEGMSKPELVRAVSTRVAEEFTKPSLQSEIPLTQRQAQNTALAAGLRTDALAVDVTWTDKWGRTWTAERTVPYRPGMTAEEALGQAGFEVGKTRRDPRHRDAVDRVDWLRSDVESSRFWTYEVNGQHPESVMADQYRLEPGSKVRWSYGRTAREHQDPVPDPSPPRGVTGHLKNFGRGAGIWFLASALSDAGSNVLTGNPRVAAQNLAGMVNPANLASMALNYGSFSVAAEAVQYPMTRYAHRVAAAAGQQALTKALDQGLAGAAANLAAQKAAAQAFKRIARFAGPAGFFAGSAVADYLTTGHLDLERWMVGGFAFLGSHALLNATVAPLIIAGLGLSSTGIGATVGVPILILASSMMASAALEHGYFWLKDYLRRRGQNSGNTKGPLDAPPGEVPATHGEPMTGDGKSQLPSGRGALGELERAEKAINEAAHGTR